MVCASPPLGSGCNRSHPRPNGGLEETVHLLAKCRHNVDNSTIDNAQWNTEQKETLC